MGASVRAWLCVLVLVLGAGAPAARAADDLPEYRLKAAFVATTHAEYFAAKGQRVLLLVDSVTRLARAAREIGLAAGEPPTTRDEFDTSVIRCARSSTTTAS